MSEATSSTGNASPFGAELQAIAQQWRANAVVTGEAFKPLPAGMARSLPTIYGECEPRWMVDAQNRPVVVKTQPKDTDKQDQIAREAIVARLANAVGFPVPPVVIWELPPAARVRHTVVSYRAFPNARDFSKFDVPVVKNILMRDDQFIFAHAFNSWVMRKDCRPHNHVCDMPSAAFPKPPIGYIDWGRSLQFSGNIGKEAEPLFKGGEADSGSILSETSFEDRFHIAKVKAQLREGQAIYQRIEKVPDSVIAEAVDAVPAPLMTHQTPQSLKDTLRYRRDNILPLTLRCAGLV